MHQVVGSHDCNGAGRDHKPLEDIRVEFPAFTAAAVQTLHCITQQGLILVEINNRKSQLSFFKTDSTPFAFDFS